MNEKLAKLKEWWGGLEENSKRMIFVVPLILAFVLYVMPRSATTQIGGYKALYKNIDVEKASAAATYLDDKGIKYQLKDNGQSIYVARDVDANRLKLALAEQDILPKEDMPGNRLLVGGSSFGEGEEQIKVKKKIALEQNLSAIISSYDQVKDAKVLITAQEKSAFVRTSQPAKASVTLTLKRGESLQGDQVNAQVAGGRGGIRNPESGIWTARAAPSKHACGCVGLSTWCGRSATASAYLQIKQSRSACTTIKSTQPSPHSSADPPAASACKAASYSGSHDRGWPPARPDHSDSDRGTDRQTYAATDAV